MGDLDDPQQPLADDFLPEHSILSLEEDLATQRSIGTETRFRVLNALVEDGPGSATQLRDRLDTRSNALHSHLDELVDVRLVENRKRKELDSDGLSSYDRATSLGDGILEHGVRELMRREWDPLEAYS